MATQKTIPKLEAEKAENERKLSQLQHKKTTDRKLHHLLRND